MSAAQPAAAPRPLQPTSFRALQRWLRRAPLRLRVARDCMAPEIPAGARVAIVRARFPLPGDVVAFHHDDGTLLLHRLIGYRMRRGRLHFLTQADRAAIADRPVRRAAVLGRAAAVETPAGDVRLRRERARALASYLRYWGQRLRRPVRPLE